MTFDKIDTTVNHTKTIRVYNTVNLDIDVIYEIEYQKVKSLTITVPQQTIDNRYKLVSAYFCNEFLKNSKVHHLIINMINVPKTSPPTEVQQPNSITADITNGSKKIKSTHLILTTIYQYSPPSKENNGCYDPFVPQSHPDATKDGTIIIGNP